MWGDREDLARKRLAGGTHGVIGGNGDGKSLLIAHDLRVLLDDGVRVLSNTRLLDYRTPGQPCTDEPCLFPEHDPSHPDHPRHTASHPLWVPWTSWDQALDWRDGAVYAGEIQSVADARDSQGLPAQARVWLRKLRHFDIPFLWDAPDWMAADAIVRRVTRVVSMAKGHRGVEHVKACVGCGRQHAKPDNDCPFRSSVRIWKDNRLFTYKTFDATQFASWTASESDKKSKKIKPKIRQTYSRKNGQAQNVYDTYAEVLTISTADAAGACTACSGVRTRLPCTCPDYLAAKTYAAAAVAAARPRKARTEEDPAHSH